ncbi:hypothetical protein SUGI_0391490 [Cryptomeria japonica]|nr:hypothetical protein SUGI_0391490 [Cryptomeria japonica]
MGSAYEEDDDDSGNLVATPVHSKYQSSTEKGIRQLCSQLLHMKASSAEELHCHASSKYSAFFRIGQDILDLENEVKELKRHISTQENLVQELRNGVGLEALINETCSFISPEPGYPVEGSLFSISNPGEDLAPNKLETHIDSLSEVLDVLLTEHKVDEALAILEEEEKAFTEFEKTEGPSSPVFLLYQSTLTEWKAMLAKQFTEIAEQPAVQSSELRKALSGLVRLGNGPLALTLLLRSYQIRLQNTIQSFLPSSAFFSGAYATTIAQLVFSTISQAAKDFRAIFEDVPEYTPELVDWAQKETEHFVKLVKQHVSFLETEAGFRAVTMCVEASISLCSLLERQGLKLCPYLLELLQPYFEGVLEAYIKQVEESVGSSAASDDWVLTSSVTHTCLDHTQHIQNDAQLVYEVKLTASAHRFISAVQDIAKCMTLFACVHFGGSILNGLTCLFDSYIDTCIRAIPCPSEDENNMDFRDNSNFIWAETEAQQLALLGNASALADELIPLSVSKTWEQQTEIQEDPSKTSPGTSEQFGSLPKELRDWRRQLQRAVDRLRDHFCRQYVLGLIYSREGSVQLTGSTYLNGRSEDLYWDPDAMPSSSFQALFTKLNQLVQLAEIVLVGRDKVVKQLLTRLTETVLIWLSNDQDFWEVIEDSSTLLTAYGLQQFILDMHFIIQIAKSGGYCSRQMHQSVSSIRTRAIDVFSSRGIDVNSALPEDEWFVETAEAAICKLRTNWSQNNLEGVSHRENDKECDGELVTTSFSGGEMIREAQGKPTGDSDAISNLRSNAAPNRGTDLKLNLDNITNSVSGDEVMPNRYEIL